MFHFLSPFARSTIRFLYNSISCLKSRARLCLPAGQPVTDSYLGDRSSGLSNTVIFVRIFQSDGENRLSYRSIVAAVFSITISGILNVSVTYDFSNAHSHNYDSINKLYEIITLCSREQRLPRIITNNTNTPVYYVSYHVTISLQYVVSCIKSYKILRF